MNKLLKGGEDMKVIIDILNTVTGEVLSTVVIELERGTELELKQVDMHKYTTTFRVRA